MASGKLGNADLTALTNTTVYTVPAGKLSTVNISLANRSTATIVVRVAIATIVTPTNAEWIEYDTAIPANGVLERTGVVCGAGENVVCYASASGISARIFGFEE